MTNLEFSQEGEIALVKHEGEVLKAYRCPAGVWTIGCGLTKHSGVITPRPGMVISKKESRRLMHLAIERNYAPRVRKHLDTSVVRHPQAAFDGGVSFDFNSGRIHNASWPRLFRSRQFPAARKSLMQWVKGGGRVLKGLERRRRDEAEMIFEGHYPSIVPARPKPHREFSAFVIELDNETRKEVRAALASLGYKVGDLAPWIRASAVRAFQRDHDLTRDGLIGRATLSALQREIDAAKKTVTAGTGAAAGGGSVAGSDVIAETVPAGPESLGLSPELVTAAGSLLLAGAVLYGLWLAFTYRDIIAVRIANVLPGAAAWLRSF